MKTSIPRLRRVRFKDGRVLEVLRPPKSGSEKLKGLMRDAFEREMARNERLAGFALVAWESPSNTSVAYLHTDGSIPSILVPDFVRNRLLASKIEDWTIDTINGN